MGQTICGGSRKEPEKKLNLSIFANSKHFCTIRKKSPYYRKKIRRAERRVANAKMVYKNYKESKICRNKRAVRGGSL
jgi:hypothetical protein